MSTKKEEGIWKASVGDFRSWWCCQHRAGQDLPADIPEPFLLDESECTRSQQRLPFTSRRVHRNTVFFRLLFTSICLLIFTFQESKKSYNEHDSCSQKMSIRMERTGIHTWVTLSAHMLIRLKSKHRSLSPHELTKDVC